MKVLKVEPYTEPYEIEISGGLKSLQNEVGGYIEVLYPSDDLIGIVCNEEGKINGMELNRSVYDDSGNRIDIIAGPFLVVGLSEDNFTSLPDDLMKKYKRQFNRAEMFVKDAHSGDIKSIKFEASKADAARTRPDKTCEDRSER